MAEPIFFEPARRRRVSTADAALAALVVAAVGLMIVPLPTWLLDLLLATNLAISVSILLVTLYVGDALKVAAFPTLLLITTLVRLALNISSTRLILLQADAGKVIHAFGHFVVQSNYVVGAVIFLILAIIQFVVIAKGSERVAEVGARFTLDAMPGKQMAVDAELRAGTIDAVEARRRRKALERENQFYGAMDGAVKFVKGDVIASFIITAINITGGLTIGVLQREMEVGAALRRYGLLTIGDGLVTQIPALLIATAAGILVTRVASEDDETTLGEQLSSQLFDAPRALRVSSVFVALLALVPGLPALPFLLISFVLFLASRARVRAIRQQEERARSEPVQREAGGARFVPVVVPWAIEVSTELGAEIEDEIRGGSVRRPGVRSRMELVRETLFRELGVPLPVCRVSIDPELPAGHAVLSIREVPARVFELGPDENAADQVEGGVLPLLRDRAADFLGIAETQALLDQLEQVAPATVRQVVPKVLDVPRLSEVLKRLLEEHVSIRDLRAILESLAKAPDIEGEVSALADHVRSELRRSLTYELTGGTNELAVVTLDAPIEETIRSAISKTAAGSFLALAPAPSRDIVLCIEHAVAAADLARPVVLSAPDIRRFVRKLIETDLPDVRVVSFSELLPEVSLRTVATAQLGDGPQT